MEEHTKIDAYTAGAEAAVRWMHEGNNPNLKSPFFVAWDTRRACEKWLENRAAPNNQRQFRINRFVDGWNHKINEIQRETRFANRKAAS